ncbi:hypothetical protein [Candidatus Macondimonas diazotrophica]|jgi:aminoglycoside phosphotransferase family enzyme|uniref:Aminoglycoside phosphotransferase domain-containing protein n=1 Tax=Candidatus Macondimonas diazotrophica TaxID=2305248 RepID=A0A4Z0FBB5_9GAMM|nr:hypothetical protein [Candidatus Macondimonas diazotrophica]NCU01496.1 hypothetical protein [Candidatus Macondimonas diazotrophica]TFZ83093.1 hypothetical protein E4680_05525 [Candidatus Macondimonas diazotrophica]HCO43459.1 hypothetical protein [Gammaproteobacteria bacterium]
MKAGAGDALAVSPAEKRAFLCQGGVLSEDDSAPVQVVETRSSWVFLTNVGAYKLKKPLRSRMIDLTSVAARGRNATLELHLNRRLAPTVYTGLLPLICDRSGLRVGPVVASPTDGPLDPAHVVDWLVGMHRLPAARMLDRLIGDGRLDDAVVEGIGVHLGDFYRAQPALPLNPGVYVEGLRRTIDGEGAILATAPEWVDAERLSAALRRQREFLNRRGLLLAERASAGRIIEGHGDLRPEHVCCLEPPVIFDCLEFSRELRMLDAVDELAYLGLECARLGQPGTLEGLLAAYGACCEDDPPAELVRFYQRYRALVRAKLALWHLIDLPHDRPAKWRTRLETYLTIAAGP